MKAISLEQAAWKFTALGTPVRGLGRRAQAGATLQRHRRIAGTPMTNRPETGFEERVRDRFNRQNAMRLLRATLAVIRHGMTEIHLPHWQGVEQQHGFVQTLILTQAEVFSVDHGKETLCALMQQTIMVMHGRAEK